MTIDELQSRVDDRVHRMEPQPGVAVMCPTSTPDERVVTVMIHFSVPGREAYRSTAVRFERHEADRKKKLDLWIDKKLEEALE